METQIENELKFVLAPEFNETALSGWKRTELKQGYHEDGYRYRNEDGHFTINKKTWSAEDNAQHETEGEITEEEFSSKWDESDIRLNKVRYKKMIGDEEWVVDFFKADCGSTYFIMAEVEMPEGREAPLHMPDIIKDNIIYSPAKDDKDFTSINLADQRHADAIMRRILP
ncbi:MAG TPA: hypothetical protein PLF01_05360 [Alphaproteobacteria bacterium]|nr:hypothetical protein [Alphaproteobacteria bacterium]